METEENLGKLINIDVESGDYEVGADKESLNLSRRLIAKNPDAQIIELRIGYPAVSVLPFPRLKLSKNLCRCNQPKKTRMMTKDFRPFLAANLQDTETRRNFVIAYYEEDGIRGLQAALEEITRADAVYSPAGNEKTDSLMAVRTALNRLGLDFGLVRTDKSDAPREGSKQGWRAFVGVDENNPDFAEMVRLGREWRFADSPNEDDDPK